MKRHIFFIGTLCNGGAERVVSILAGHMAKQGMDVEILTYYDRPVSYELDSRVKLTAVETMTGSGNKVKNLLAIRKYFKRNVRIVISFLAPFNMMAIAANLGNGVPMIVADRNDPTKVPSNAAVRKVRDVLYRFATGVVVQTQKNKAYFCQAVQKKSKVIYNPIDLKDYAAIALHTEKEKKIVTAGRLMPQKNQKMMIRSFASVHEKHPDYQLVIYGEGPSRDELEALVKELGLVKCVLLPGNISDIHEHIKNAEIFVLSSDYEGMPNALIEAMCLGLPSISTKVSGATDLIKDHENGLLTELNNQEQLEKAMLELIENKELADKLAKNAAKLNEELEVSKIMQQWIDFIKELT
ncbi:MAG: glycosyltransferase family 4 protein [Lachnospiraceae bacterium]|nr:glycosyltransferase family 4 protein [Lachnospiraceae bacterium]